MISNTVASTHNASTEEAAATDDFVSGLFAQLQQPQASLLVSAQQVLPMMSLRAQQLAARVTASTHHASTEVAASR